MQSRRQGPTGTRQALGDDDATNMRQTTPARSPTCARHRRRASRVSAWGGIRVLLLPGPTDQPFSLHDSDLVHAAPGAPSSPRRSGHVGAGPRQRSRASAAAGASDPRVPPRRSRVVRRTSRTARRVVPGRPRGVVAGDGSAERAGARTRPVRRAHPRDGAAPDLDPRVASTHLFLPVIAPATPRRRRPRSPRCPRPSLFAVVARSRWWQAMTG